MTCVVVKSHKNNAFSYFFPTSLQTLHLHSLVKTLSRCLRVPSHQSSSGKCLQDTAEELQEANQRIQELKRREVQKDKKLEEANEKELQKDKKLQEAEQKIQKTDKEARGLPWPEALSL